MLPRLCEYVSFPIRLENFYIKQSILFHLFGNEINTLPAGGSFIPASSPLISKGQHEDKGYDHAMHDDSRTNQN